MVNVANACSDTSFADFVFQIFATCGTKAIVVREPAAKPIRELVSIVDFVSLIPEGGKKMINSRNMALAALSAALLAGCATWSTGSVDRREQAVAAKPTDPARITITEGDVSRKYTSLGDVSVTVNKTTVFNKDPTREMVNDKLKEKAAELGADAVILVRYG